MIIEGSFSLMLDEMELKVSTECLGWLLRLLWLCVEDNEGALCDLCEVAVAEVVAEAAVERDALESRLDAVPPPNDLFEALLMDADRDRRLMEFCVLFLSGTEASLRLPLPLPLAPFLGPLSATSGLFSLSKKLCIVSLGGPLLWPDGDDTWIWNAGPGPAGVGDDGDAGPAVSSSPDSDRDADADERREDMSGSSVWLLAWLSWTRCLAAADACADVQAEEGTLLKMKIRNQRDALEQHETPRLN